MLSDIDFVTRARNFALEAHESTNHRYGDGKKLPYSYHLLMVASFAKRFSGLLSTSQHDIVIAAAWCHDAIEDARVTYNDIVTALKLPEQTTAYDEPEKMVAEIVYLLTNDKGRTRKERAGAAYYAGIHANDLATYVKLCDRLANVYYSTYISKSSMADVYRKEFAEFKRQLWRSEFATMFVLIEDMLGGWITDETKAELERTWTLQLEMTYLSKYLPLHKNQGEKPTSYVDTDHIVRWMSDFVMTEPKAAYMHTQLDRVWLASHVMFHDRVSDETLRENGVDPTSREERKKFFRMLASFVAKEVM